MCYNLKNEDLFMSFDRDFIIYVDLDGVAADFAAGVRKLVPSFMEGSTENNKKLDREMWTAISKHQKAGNKFWYELPPMEDAFVLWEFVKPYNPQILTATGNPSFGAGPQKLEWVAKYFGSDVVVNIVQRSADKATFATPNSILVDDKLKAIEPYRSAGGIGVHHTSALDSIEQIKQILNI